MDDQNSEIEFCKCGDGSSSVSTEMNGFGYWDVCSKCGKPIQDSFHYFDHYDGEDHPDNPCLY